MQVKTSPVPAKNPYFSTLKSTNYLVNTLCLMDAEADEVDQGIFLDSNGNIAEGPNMNVAIITADGVLVVRPFSLGLSLVGLYFEPNLKCLEVHMSIQQLLIVTPRQWFRPRFEFSCLNR